MHLSKHVGIKIYSFIKPRRNLRNEGGESIRQSEEGHKSTNCTMEPGWLRSKKPTLLNHRGGGERNNRGGHLQGPRLMKKNSGGLNRRREGWKDQQNSEGEGEKKPREKVTEERPVRYSARAQGGPGSLTVSKVSEAHPRKKEEKRLGQVFRAAARPRSPSTSYQGRRTFKEKLRYLTDDRGRMV